jgi:hypothetical protein
MTVLVSVSILTILVGEKSDEGSEIALRTGLRDRIEQRSKMALGTSIGGL